MFSVEETGTSSECLRQICRPYQGVTGAIRRVCVPVLPSTQRQSCQDLFTLDNNNKGTRGHTLKLSKMRSTRDCRKYFFLTEWLYMWNMLDQQIVGATGLNAFKNGLDAIRKTKMDFFMD